MTEPVPESSVMALKYEKGAAMSDGERIEERIQTEEVTLGHNSEFAVVRKHTRDKEAPQEALRQHDYLRAVEDSVEQNDNAFDGIVNNLPEDATGSVSGVADPKKEEEKKSLVEEIKKQAEATPPPAHVSAPRILYTDGEERVL